MSDNLEDFSPRRSGQPPHKRRAELATGNSAWEIRKALESSRGNETFYDSFVNMVIAQNPPGHSHEAESVKTIARNQVNTAIAKIAQNDHGRHTPEEWQDMVLRRLTEKPAAGR